MDTTTRTDLHEPSGWQDQAPASEKPPAGSESTDLRWSLGGQAPGPAHFPTDEERKILAEMAADERLKEEKAERDKAERAVKAARKKAAAARS